MQVQTCHKKLERWILWLVLVHVYYKIKAKRPKKILEKTRNTRRRKNFRCDDDIQVRPNSEKDIKKQKPSSSSSTQENSNQNMKVYIKHVHFRNVGNPMKYMKLHKPYCSHKSWQTVITQQYSRCRNENICRPLRLVYV